VLYGAPRGAATNDELRLHLARSGGVGCARFRTREVSRADTKYAAQIWPCAHCHLRPYARTVGVPVICASVRTCTRWCTASKRTRLISRQTDCAWWQSVARRSSRAREVQVDEKALRRPTHESGGGWGGLIGLFRRNGGRMTTS
jgi:hypothetical protein